MNLKQRVPKIEYDDFDLIDEKILRIRGIYKDIQRDFLNPTKDYLNDPFLLKNMDIAIDMIQWALANNKKIGIYGDPDTDGVTATQIKYGYLKIFTDNIYYILNQREEGHGVIVNKVKKDTGLLIIVDSSTNSVNECKKLSEMGIKILILDHHESDSDNPYATIVNPQMCDYPNKSLSGAGVCWQTIRAFDMFNGIEFANDFADLACVGIVGDMMDMSIMENRYIVRLGLTNINNRVGNTGLLSLFKELGKNFNPTSQDISFYIAPCLNAIIRLDDINIILELFNTEDADVCKLISKDIKKKNEERKELTDDIYKSLEGTLNDDKVVIVDMTESPYKSAMFGLIANKIARLNQRPCFVGRVIDGEFRGSGRGFGEEIELKDELLASKLFNLVAGHQNSFGVRFNIDKIYDIKSYVNAKFAEYFNEQFVEYDMQIDYEDMSEFNLKLIDDMSKICGQGFPRPTFLIKSLIVSDFKKIGVKENHTKLTVVDDMNLDIMKFNTEESLDKYRNADYINVVGSIGINEFYNFGLKRIILTKQILSDIIICETIDI